MKSKGKRAALIIGGLAVLGALVFAGKASAGTVRPPKRKWNWVDPDPVPDCPEGMAWDPERAECVAPPNWDRPDPKRVKPGDVPDDPEPPRVPVNDPDEIDDIIKPIPVPGYFYQVRKGDIFLGTKVTDGSAGLSICYFALRRVLHDAAMVFLEITDDQAWQLVNNKQAPLGARIRSEKNALRPMLDHILCSWMNDGAYASWKYGPTNVPGPHGRAIGLVPQHAPNQSRLRAGEPMARNVRWGKPDQKLTGAAFGVNESWREYPFLWIPSVNLERFWASANGSGPLELTAADESWRDGASKASPPSWVQELGIEDFTGTMSTGTTLGCGLGKNEV